MAKQSGAKIGDDLEMSPIDSRRLTAKRTQERLAAAILTVARAYLALGVCP